MQIAFDNPDGNSVTFSNNGPIRLHDIKGIGGIEADVHTSKAPSQDGATFLGSTLDQREISITFGLFETDGNTMESLKRSAIRAFNQKNGLGTLKFDDGNGTTREIGAISDNGVEFLNGNRNRSVGFQRCHVSLVCTDPFMLDATQIVESMSAVEMRFKFDLTFPTEMGLKGAKRNMINNGDVDAPVLISFTGDVTNPIVRNVTTGEFIKVNQTLSNGEILSINTAFGNKTVQITDANGNTKNAFNYIDLDTTFWNLVTGNNVIEYDADIGRENAIVSVKWHDRYLSI